MARQLGVLAHGGMLLATPSNRWMCLAQGVTHGTATFSFNSARLVPLFMAKNATLNAVGMFITTAGSTGTVVRMGLYEADPLDEQPLTLIQDFGTVVGTTTGFKSFTGLSIALEAKRYYVASAAQVGTTTSPVCSSTSDQHPGVTAGNGATPTGNFAFPGFSVSATGAFAATITASATNGAMPKTYVRFN
jgi:hypothetical protein